MKIGVAILTLVGRIGELEIGMTVATRHLGVTSAQREACPRMVELDLAWDDLPVRGRMTRNARKFEISVRALRRSKGPRRLGAQGIRR